MPVVAAFGLPVIGLVCSFSGHPALQACLVGALCFLAGCEHGISFHDERQEDGEWVHDFGIVEAGTTHSHVFSLQNTSGGAVSFEKFQSSCNCSGLTISKTRLRPGEEFDITVNFHAGNKTYDTAPTIVGFFGGDKRWTVVLGLMAKVRQPVSLSASELRWNPAGVRDFADGTFLVRNYSKRKWSDVSLVTSASWLNLRAEPVTADEGALQMWKCTVRPLRAMLSAGNHLASPSPRTVRTPRSGCQFECLSKNLLF
jgi:hypothetical protein